MLEILPNIQFMQKLTTGSNGIEIKQYKNIIMLQLCC